MFYDFNDSDYGFYYVIYFFIFYLCCSLYFLLRYGRNAYFLVIMLLLIQITFFALIYFNYLYLPYQGSTLTLMVVISLVLLTWCYEIDSDYTIYYGYFFVLIGILFAIVGWWNSRFGESEPLRDRRNLIMGTGASLAVLSAAVIAFDVFN
jgi:glucan phosphoethanolaminetransferase (alkaline phosphatase superfamily)